MEKKIIVDEIHAPARRNFPRRKVIIGGIDETWQADLIDTKNFSHFNKGYNWLLTVINNVSKYAWVIPLKRKTKTELNTQLGCEHGIKKIFLQKKSFFYH